MEQELNKINQMEEHLLDKGDNLSPKPFYMRTDVSK